MLEMEHQVERQKRSKEMKRKSPSRVNKRNKLMTCCRCPCRAASCMFRGIGRCMFVTCYPVVQCLGLDEHRHRHHRHQGKHFDWWHHKINGFIFKLDFCFGVIQERLRRMNKMALILTFVLSLCFLCW